MAKVNQTKRCVGQYEIKETLGKGGYSWVKKGYDTKGKKTVALKFMTRADKSWKDEQAKQVSTEINSMIKIKSKNVMKLFAYNLNCEYPEKNGNTIDTILLVLEFCPGGELFDILYYTQALDEKTARTYFIQLIEGLKACHDAGIVHRDLKPQNLLLDDQFQLKITDFGLSKLVKNADTAKMKTNYVGTRGYQAPELLRKQKYGKTCDIFSAGVVLFILLTGYPPFEQAVKTDKWYNPLAMKNPKKFWEQHEGCGVKPDAQDLITQMLAYRPSARIEIENILKSKFYQGEIYSPKELKKHLKKKHRTTTKLRKKDKKKMSEMEHSQKKRGFEEMAQLLASVSCPTEKYKVRETFMTKRWIVRPCAKSEGDQKENGNSVPKEVVESYIIALRALESKGNSALEFVEESNPWDVICLVSAMDGSNFRISMSINKDHNGVYYFNFKRIMGDALKFNKFWEKCEKQFLNSKYLKDELYEEEEEDEQTQTMHRNEDDEKQ
jgi:serine/threonine protein kinase